MDCHSLLQCVKVKSLSHVRLLVTPWTTAYQVPQSMGFSRQEYRSGVPILLLAKQAFRTSGKACEQRDGPPGGETVAGDRGSSEAKGSAGHLPRRLLQWVSVHFPGTPETEDLLQSSCSTLEPLHPLPAATWTIEPITRS